MKKQYSKSLFIFRRDLRIEDNIGLRKALEMSGTVIACFILTDEQIGQENSYRSAHAIQFMAESLEELAHEIEKKGGALFFFRGQPHTVVKELIATESLEAVFVNHDYTPYSRQRDLKIFEICTNTNVAFNAYHDSLLLEPDTGLNPQGMPYQIFTPYYRKNSQIDVPHPQPYPGGPLASTISHKTVAASYLTGLVPSKVTLHSHGGRTKSLKLLTTLQEYKNYAAIHDSLALHTTGISAHNKFGTISIRELYYATSKSLGKSSGLIRQLYWRDFFSHVAWFNPHVFGHAFQKKFEYIDWSTNTNDFDRWCSGTTGFPIVDAGMRELKATGYMHNRARLIVGSFLTKDLHISWQWGEKYFAQQLTDYDPCVNNGNWQWVASTGCDSQPYFRIFNPWLQQKKFDPECIYIKRWVPELAKIDTKTIHSWYQQTKSFQGYPAPMIDHAQQTEKTKLLYKTAFADTKDLFF